MIEHIQGVQKTIRKTVKFETNALRALSEKSHSEHLQNFCNSNFFLDIRLFLVFFEN